MNIVNQLKLKSFYFCFFLKSLTTFSQTSNTNLFHYHEGNFDLGNIEFEANESKFGQNDFKFGGDINSCELVNYNLDLNQETANLSNDSQRSCDSIVLKDGKIISVSIKNMGETTIEYVECGLKPEEIFSLKIDSVKIVKLANGELYFFDHLSPFFGKKDKGSIQKKKQIQIDDLNKGLYKEVNNYSKGQDPEWKEEKKDARTKGRVTGLVITGVPAVIAIPLWFVILFVLSNFGAV